MVANTASVAVASAATDRRSTCRPIVINRRTLGDSTKSTTTATIGPPWVSSTIPPFSPV
jgi:hypothetical protein